MKKLLIAFLVTFTIPTFAKVGKVIILKGDVKAEYVGKTVKLKKGDWVKQGTVVKTGEKSFTKILFKDKNSIVVGSNSEVKIESYKAGKPGLINLLKGQVRSKVNKSRLGKRASIKFLIKTDTAVMGVRGTEFQVNYYNKTKRTALVTISGEVLMVKVPKRIKSIKRLKKWLSKKSTVSVKRGQYSMNGTKPVKIDEVQLNKLERYELPGTAKTFRDVAPKGAEGFVGDVKIEKKNKLKSRPKIDFGTGMTFKKKADIYIDPSKIKQLERKGKQRRSSRLSEKTRESVLDKIRKKRDNDRDTNTVVGRAKTQLKLKLRKQ